MLFYIIGSSEKKEKENISTSAIERMVEAIQGDSEQTFVFKKINCRVYSNS